MAGLYENSLQDAKVIDIEEYGTADQRTNQCTTSKLSPAPSVAEQASKQAAYHHEKLIKSERAGLFLRLHPEFDEFIQLVRSGVIQL